MELVIGHLYPDHMNIYGDRGNIITLRERCQRRGIAVRVENIGPGDPFDADAYDLIFMGGGQDKAQWQIAEDLLKTKGEAVRVAVENGVAALLVCGGYQLFGHYYRPATGPDLPGLGILDMVTVHKGADVARCIGNIAAKWDGGVLVGFENHGGRTYLGANAAPLARVLAGHGNNAEDGTEGAVYKYVHGTYMHGSLLPKNPAFADHLVRLALKRRYGDVELLPLADEIEKMAHDAAVRIATAARR